MIESNAPFGPSLKKIRENKGYTQEKVARNAMNRSTYTRFEAENITTNAIKYFQILSNLDMTHKEFSYIHNSYQLSKKEDLLFQFNSITTNSDVALLMQLKDNAEVYLLTHDDAVIKDIVQVYHALLTLAQTNDLKKAYTHAETVWFRLEKMDKWYLTELRLLNNILFFFPAETSLFISKRALIDLNFYRHFEESAKLQSAFSMNLIFLLMENKDFKQALIQIEELIIKTKSDSKYVMLAVLYVRKGIVLEKIGTKLEVDYFIQKGFNLLDAIEETDIKKELEQELTYFIEKK
ncbi:Rgg/GadR/MutR family transcriptional regulator [Carnobacterium sp.]|uniref:helix-turn-helix domain-containing protein n=1 Tax=Carnobacterium sp. TaxID=48221 RepID=UPI003C710E35